MVNSVLMRETNIYMQKSFDIVDTYSRPNYVIHMIIIDERKCAHARLYTLTSRCVCVCVCATHSVIGIYLTLIWQLVCNGNVELEQNAIVCEVCANRILTCLCRE